MHTPALAQTRRSRRSMVFDRRTWVTPYWILKFLFANVESPKSDNTRNHGTIPNQINRLHPFGKILDSGFIVCHISIRKPRTCLCLMVCNRGIAFLTERQTHSRKIAGGDSDVLLLRSCTFPMDPQAASSLSTGILPEHLGWLQSGFLQIWNRNCEQCRSPQL